MKEQRPQSPPETRRTGSWLRTLRAVAWSMIGVRKDSQYQQDLQKINPLHLIAIGLLAIFTLVLSLIALVHWIV
ncbi:DUF2970 domain-containing protein [Simplicispira psychrophila]|uniref:DUF2970 domain-containing protein n=1 Tax=Simplicispira psychrophila TaxID=80882 RepID=UPI000489F0F5|nr:DUF2970 domain-containing protein [Simplicispira psychrophila]